MKKWDVFVNEQKVVEIEAESAHEAVEVAQKTSNEFAKAVVDSIQRGQTATTKVKEVRK